MTPLPDRELIAAVGRCDQRFRAAVRTLEVGFIVWFCVQLMLFFLVNDVDTTDRIINFHGDDTLKARFAAGTASFFLFILAAVSFTLGMKAQWALVPLAIVGCTALSAFTVNSQVGAIVLSVLVAGSFAAAYALLLPLHPWSGMYDFIRATRDIDDDVEWGIHQVLAVRGAVPGPWGVDLAPVEAQREAPQFFHLELPAPPQAAPGDFVVISAGGQIEASGRIQRRG